MCTPNVWIVSYVSCISIKVLKNQFHINQWCSMSFDLFRKTIWYSSIYQYDHYWYFGLNHYLLGGVPLSWMLNCILGLYTRCQEYPFPQLRQPKLSKKIDKYSLGAKEFLVNNHYVECLRAVIRQNLNASAFINTLCF